VSRDGDGAAHAAVAATGPRALGREREVREAVAAVHEGWRAHYGAAQDEGADDPDLALLVGDRRYADGLERLAALGDLPAIAELADVISLCAVAHAAGEPDLADAAWRAGAVAVGWGPTQEIVGAKTRARAGQPGAADALLAAVRHVTAQVAPER
jgi:hypothetical protein